MELSDYGEAIALLATFLFMIQMLTPLLTFYRVYRTKTLGDLPVEPYVTAFLSCSVWMLYGIVIKDSYVTNTNLYGAFLQFAFTLCYYSHTVNKSKVFNQLGLSLFIFTAASLYCWTENDHNILVARMAMFCCLVTLAFFAAPFSNLRLVLREKNAESLPCPLIFFTFVVSFLWMLYGVAINDLALKLTNFIGVILSSMQLFLIAWFRNPQKYGSKALLVV